MNTPALSRFAAGVALLALAACQTSQTVPSATSSAPAATVQQHAVVSPETAIVFPKDFFVDEIRGPACHHHPRNWNFDARWEYVSEISKIDGAAFDERGTSLTVHHDDLSKRWATLLDLTYDAAARKDAGHARRMVELLLHFVERETMFSTPKLSELANTKCWEDGNPLAKCPTHTTQHGSFYFIAFTYAAIVLREHMSEQEKRLLHKYIERSYRDYIRPVAELLQKSSGFYEFAHNGLGILAYANWSNDSDLARKEIRRTVGLISRVVNRKGYIDNNSYRGVRSYWYHTLGADPMLGYAIVAREHGVDLFKDPKVGPKLKALADATLEGGADLKKFESKGYRGTKFSKNYSTNPKHARPHMHQLAVSLPMFVMREFGIDVPTAPRYQRLVQYETIDRFVGFNAACYYGSKEQPAES